MTQRWKKGSRESGMNRRLAYGTGESREKLGQTLEKTSSEATNSFEKRKTTGEGKTRRGVKTVWHKENNNKGGKGGKEIGGSIWVPMGKQFEKNS